MHGRYCVIIPAFNAEKTIGTLVTQIKAHGLPVLVVDDGSHDQTAAIASTQGALVISHLRNEGKGVALRTGFEHALRSHYDGVVTMDSDEQHDPSEILRLIEEGEHVHAGIVVGNRMANGRAMPSVRHWTNRAMSSVISSLARQPIPDSQCGFRFIRKEVLETIPLRSRRFEVESELLLRAAARQWKIVSVPVRTIYDHHRSHIQPLPDTLRFLRLLARYLIHR